MTIPDPLPSELSSTLDPLVPADATAHGRSSAPRSKASAAPRGRGSRSMLPRPGSPPVEWHVHDTPMPYAATTLRMERAAAAIAAGEAPEQVWLLEHPPLYTSGTKARPQDLIDARFPVHRAGRGGEFTYHGPGQRVAYAMLDLRRRTPDVRAYVAALEDWLIGTLAGMNVTGERRADRVGVWVRRPERAPLPDGNPAEDKIAAIGVRLRKWVAFHGVSLNVEPDLTHYDGIVPCGIRGYGVTSLHDLGHLVTMPEVDARLRAGFEDVFGPTVSRR